ncbi:MAG: hypothetical protein WC750_04885 [Patescibacteria group bacterium]|jgi:hypothetical protein
MRRYLVGLITLVVICLFAGRSTAQSNVHSQEERGVFAQMDPALEGYWEGHAGANDGMKYDPVAIACMLSKCSRVRNENSADPNQLRDARNFRTCYAAHLARVQSGYVRLSNPPLISDLGCNRIAAQAKSTDDRVYAAVNGRPRNQPPTTTRAKKHRRANVSIEERAYLLAQVSKPMVDDNPYKDDAPKVMPKPITQPKLATKPTVAPRRYANDSGKPTAPKVSTTSSTTKRYGGLGENLVLVNESATEAEIYVKPGGQFYTVRSSYLAEKYEVDWKAVYTYAGNQYADFIGSCWHGNKVALDADRMRAKSYDRDKLMGPVDPDFMNACDGDFNFALQAGRKIVLPAKKSTIAQAAPSNEPDQPPAEQPKQTQANENPLPAESATPPPAMDLDAYATQSSTVAEDLPEVSIKVSRIGTPPETPMESVAAPSASEQPPPSDSATISAVNGKKWATPMDWQEFQRWFKGWPSDFLLAALGSLLVGGVILYEHRRWRRRKQASQAPPPTGWGAGPDEPTEVTGQKK